MKKLRLILLILTLALVAIFAAGCGSGEDSSLEGKNIVTFEMNGGTLKYGTSSTKTNINFAYHPGTKILDPSSDIGGYELMRAGYNFTGWYTSEECKSSQKWNFDTLFDTETLTLYAGWEKAVKYTFDICYVDGEGKTVVLGSWSAKEGGTVAQSFVKNEAEKREGYTPFGYYRDAALTVPWSFATKHPGGETDTSVPIYVKYIEGEWSMVSNFAQLKSALSGGENVYLTSDIDCGGAELSFIGKTYGGILEGNGYSVNNFTVSASEGVLALKRCAIFDTLSPTAVIRNVDFVDVSYVVTVADGVEGVTFEVATIALSADGATISYVTVSGRFLTNYGGELPSVEAAVLVGTPVIDGYTASVTVNPQ